MRVVQRVHAVHAAQPSGQHASAVRVVSPDSSLLRVVQDAVHAELRVHDPHTRMDNAATGETQTRASTTVHFAHGTQKQRFLLHTHTVSKECEELASALAVQQQQQPPL